MFYASGPSSNGEQSFALIRCCGCSVVFQYSVFFWENWFHDVALRGLHGCACPRYTTEIWPWISLLKSHGQAAPWLRGQDSKGSANFSDKWQWTLKSLHRQLDHSIVDLKNNSNARVKLAIEEDALTVEWPPCLEHTKKLCSSESYFWTGFTCLDQNSVLLD